MFEDKRTRNVYLILYVTHVMYSVFNAFMIYINMLTYLIL